MVRVLFPSATLDCASDVISHTCHPFVGVTNIVERVTSLEEHVGAVFQVTVSSAKESHACALTVKDEVPVTLCLYNPNKALVGVIAAGNGNSDKSNVRIIFDSPEPAADIPKSSWPLSPSAELGRLESIVASGTPGKSPVSSNTEPWNRVTVLLPAPSSLPIAFGTLNAWTEDHLPSRWSWSALTLQ